MRVCKRAENEGLEDRVKDGHLRCDKNAHKPKNKSVRQLQGQPLLNQSECPIYYTTDENRSVGMTSGVTCSLLLATVIWYICNILMWAVIVVLRSTESGNIELTSLFFLQTETANEYELPRWAYHTTLYVSDINLCRGVGGVRLERGLFDMFNVLKSEHSSTHSEHITVNTG